MRIEKAIRLLLLTLGLSALADAGGADSPRSPASQGGGVLAGMAQPLPRRIDGTNGETYPYYANLPQELWPFRNVEPYYRYWITRLPFRGPGRDYPLARDLKSLKIGLLSPSRYGPNGARGERTREGVVLAIEQANAVRRTGEPPFELIEREDAPQWGSAANMAVDFADAGVLGLIGTIDDTATHVALRVSLKTELVIINTSDPDPTLTETLIPWLLRIFPDERLEEALLAERMVKQRGCKRIVVMRENSRSGRVGVMHFDNFIRRLGSPAAQELLFKPGERDIGRQIGVIKASQPDAVFFQGQPDDIGRFAKQFRQAGIQAPFFGLDLLMEKSFQENAGAAAEGMTVGCLFDPAKTDPLWVRFVDQFQKRWGRGPDVYAAYGYDGAQLMIGAIQRAGPNRWRVRDQLLNLDAYHGVTGWMRFDGRWDNIAPVTLAQFRNGQWQAAPATSYSPFANGEFSRK